MNVYDANNMHVATISVRFMPNGTTRYVVRDRWYMTTNRERAYKTIEAAITHTRKRYA